MSKISIRVAGAAAAALAVGSLTVFTPSVFASAIHPLNTHGHVFDLGQSPAGVGNCSFANNDASFFTVSGNAVSHESTNNNGDWGGLTFTGTAIFQETPFMSMPDGSIMDDGPTVQLYEGHLTYWDGGGNNKAGQSEGGFTADFHGTAMSGTGSIDIHVNAHETTNNAGTPTVQMTNVNVTCS